MLLQPQNHIGIHLNETAISIKSEPRIIGTANQAADRSIIETKIKYSIHHSGHRVARTGANRNEQRVVSVPEATAQDFLNASEAKSNLTLKIFRVALIMFIEVSTNFGSNRKTRRNGNTDAGHLMQARSFTAEKLAHSGTTVCFAVSKSKNELFFLRHVASPRRI